MQNTLQLLPLWAQVVLALVPAISAIFAAIGLLLNVLQSKRTNTQARATLVAKCLERFTDDHDMQEMFYKIEYRQFVYEQDTFHESIEEKQLDKLLMHFSSTALAWQSGLLTNKDIQPLEYLVRRILRNEGVAEYLKFVSDWSARANLGKHPYIALSQMGRAIAA